MAGIFKHTRGAVGDDVMGKMYSYATDAASARSRSSTSARRATMCSARSAKASASPRAEPTGGGELGAAGGADAGADSAARPAPDAAATGDGVTVTSPGYIRPRSPGARWAALLDSEEIKAAIERGVTAREWRDEADKAVRESARLKARTAQKRAAQAASRAPMPTSTPAAPRWRKKNFAAANGGDHNQACDAAPHTRPQHNHTPRRQTRVVCSVCRCALSCCAAAYC